MDTADQLSATSAACALAALAINTTALPSGDVLGIPRKWTFLFRLSPTFCGLVAVESLWNFTKMNYNEPSLTKAATRWKEDRFASGDPPERSRPLQVASRIVLLILALSQATKLYATAKIPVSWMFCTFYLLHYLTDASIMALAPHDAGTQLPRDKQEPRQEGLLAKQLSSNLASPISVSLNVVACMWFLRASAAFPAARSVGFLPVSLFFGVPMWLTAFTCLGVVCRKQDQTRQMAVAFLLQSATTLVVLDSDQYLGWTIMGVISFLCLTLVPRLIAAASSWGWGEHSWWARTRMSQRLDFGMGGPTEVGLAASFVLWHAFGAVIWYGYTYNPAITSRPAWTTYLG